MTVDELIITLQEMSKNGAGSLIVYGTSERGELPDKICSPLIYYTDELGHCLWDNWSSEGNNDLYQQPFVLL